MSTSTQNRRTEILLGHLRPKTSAAPQLTTESCSAKNQSSALKNPLKVKILGVGRFLPPHVISSETVDEICGVPKGYTQRTSGIKERRYTTSIEKLAQKRNGAFMNYKYTPDPSLSQKTEKEIDAEMGAISMAVEASKEACADAGIKLSDLVYVINASGTSERCLPDSSVLLQRDLGLGGSGIPCMSVNTICLSFLVGLQTAAALLESGLYNGPILVVSSEDAVCALNFTGDPHSAGLMGCGSAAVIIGPTPDGESSCIKSLYFESHGDGADLTTIRSGGSKYHPSYTWCKEEHKTFKMQSKELVKYSSLKGGPFLQKLLPGITEGTAFDKIDVIIPHQASLAFLEILIKVFGIPRSKMVGTLEKYGNCVSVSIPLTLYEAIKVDKKLKRGDSVLLFGTAAGLTLGGMLLTY